MNNKTSLVVGILIGGLVVAVVILTLENIKLKKDDTSAKIAETASSGQFNAASVNIDDDPYLGDIDKAEVAVVEFSDYECPFCKKFHDSTFDQIVKKYVETNKAILVFRDYPLDFHNPAATTDANAASCVKELGDNNKYFAMAKQLYNNSNLNGQGIPRDKLIDFAEKVGVDKSKFSQCLESNKFQDEINKDLKDGSRAGIDGTPGFVVGKLQPNGNVIGELVVGAQPFSVFETVIEKELKK